MSLREKLSYKPSELKFGTSGLRGLLSDMTDLECYINTRGFLDLLGISEGTVYLAGDLRSSTPRIMTAVAQAIVDVGLEYENCGLIPTPAVADYAGAHNSACIMVTGSHIPDDRNGIKFYKTDGEVLKADEDAIKASVSAVREQLYNSDSEIFDENGQLKAPESLSAVVSEAEENYKKRYTDFFEDDCLSGKKIVLYEHSAVGRDVISEILESLGAEMVRADRSEAFIPIDTENVTPDDEAHFETLARDNPGCFAIVSTDGDSDRPFVIDENGRFNRGDELGLVVSRYLGADAAAFPVSSNDAVVEALKSDGTTYSLTKIGSPHVIVEMQALAARAERVVGWEVNGGFLTHSDITFGSKTLKPLPTRDALLPIICAILAAKDSNQSLSDLFDDLPKRFTQAGLIDNFNNDNSAKIVETLAHEDERANQLVSKVFTAENGFDQVDSIDSTDGIRIRFRNNDVAHLRPSGNAPQLRIYSNADSQDRADQIVKDGIRESNGLLRQLEKLV